MKRDLTHALDECLALLGEERATLEECLARYPEYASDLCPLLNLAREVRGLPQPTPSPAAFTAGKQRMLDALAEKRDGLAVRKRASAFRLALAGALALALFAISRSLLLSWPGAFSRWLILLQLVERRFRAFADHYLLNGDASTSVTVGCPGYARLAKPVRCDSI